MSWRAWLADLFVPIPMTALPTPGQVTGGSSGVPVEPIELPPAAEWDRVSCPAMAIELIKVLEAFSATPYDDNGSAPGGTWTIGYGSIRDGLNNPVTPNTTPITTDQAAALLKRDIAWAVTAVARRVSVPLAPCQAGALISWTYNLGEGSLSSSTMLKRINAGAGNRSITDQMAVWINQAGKPLTGLRRRRWTEAAVWCGMNPVQARARAWIEINDVQAWPLLPGV